MNKIKSILSLALAVTVIALAGCKTSAPRPGETPEQTAARAAAEKQADIKVAAIIAQSAARTGAAFALASNPELRPVFELEIQRLRLLASDPGADMVALQDAVGRLPVKELKGPEGAVILSGISTAIVIIDAAEKKYLSADTKEWVAPIAAGIALGIEQGIAK